MKHEILKKTLLYRSFSFGLTMIMSTIILNILVNDMLLSWYLSIFTEMGAVVLYYIYEYFWRRHINSERVKKGMNVLMIKGNSDKHNWYEVIEDLGEGKIIIKVV